MADVKSLIVKLETNKILSKEEFHTLLNHISDEDLLYLRERACITARKHFGNKIISGINRIYKPLQKMTATIAEYGGAMKMSIDIA